MAPDAGRPREANPGAGQIAHLDDEHPHGTECVCAVTPLLRDLNIRVAMIEARLNAAPSALSRQRRYSSTRLSSSSPTLRYLAQREEVLG
jgi:hypothetical protein